MAASLSATDVVTAEDDACSLERALEDRRELDVVRHHRAVGHREDQASVPTFLGDEEVRTELVGDRDLTDLAGLRRTGVVGARDRDEPSAEVDVVPLEAGELALAQAGVDRRGKRGRIRAEHSDLLRAELLAAAVSSGAMAAEGDAFGQRYVLDFPMKGPLGEAMVRSSWIVRSGEDLPRLTSCYVM